MEQQGMGPERAAEIVGDAQDAYRKLQQEQAGPGASGSRMGVGDVGRRIGRRAVGRQLEGGSEVPPNGQLSQDPEASAMQLVAKVPLVPSKIRE